jgi:hypothetical protein
VDGQQPAEQHAICKPNGKIASGYFFNELQADHNLNVTEKRIGKQKCGNLLHTGRISARGHQVHARLKIGWER